MMTDEIMTWILP